MQSFVSYFLFEFNFKVFLKLSFQLTFKASLPNSYSNSNWKLHFQIVILIQIQIWSLVSEFQCSNSSSMLCFQILIWIGIPNRVFEFLFESEKLGLPIIILIRIQIRRFVSESLLEFFFLQEFGNQTSNSNLNKSSGNKLRIRIYLKIQIRSLYFKFRWECRNEASNLNMNNNWKMKVRIRILLSIWERGFEVEFKDSILEMITIFNWKINCPNQFPYFSYILSHSFPAALSYQAKNRSSQ